MIADFASLINIFIFTIFCLYPHFAFARPGNKFDIQIPNTKEALDAYEDGRRLYFTKKGQLNFSCADCHVYQTGTKLRADIPSPAIGHPTHFPVYRSGMGRLVTLHERFAGCLNRIRAKSFKGGSDELNNLEFFTKYSLIFFMIVGRIELLTILLLIRKFLFTSFYSRLIIH